MVNVRWALLGAGILLGAAAVPASADDDPFLLKDPSTLMVGAGSWEVARDNLRTYEFDAALRPDLHLWLIKPQIGVVAAGDGDVVLYAGPMLDYKFTDHWMVTASTSVGYWTSGGFDLGSHIEFRSGLDLSYRFANAVRVGIGFYHTSNADISTRNPGSESALLEYSIPLNLGF
jgi:hypothetical protein